MTVNTLGSHEQYRSSRTDPTRTVAEWLWPFLPGGIAVFSLSAVFWYHTHRDAIEVRAPLQHLYAGIYHAFGLAPSVMFFVLVVIWSAIWLVTGKLDRPFSRLGRLVAMLVMLGIFLNIGDGGVAPAPSKGALGAWLAENLVGTFSYVPSLILVWAITFASLLLATDFCFHDAFERLRHKPAGPAPDAGVEVAVTDHLRGLSTAVAPPPAAANGAIAEHQAPAAAVGIVDLAPLDIEPEPAPEPEHQSEPAFEPGSSRRRSYFERRAEREGRAAPSEEPTEPEIESPIEPTTELPARAAAADLAIDDALPLDPPLEAAVDGSPPAAADRIVSDVYETAEAIEAEDLLDDTTADLDDTEDSDGPESSERWVPIPRPEPAPVAEESVVEEPVAQEPVAEVPVAEEPVAAVPVAEEETDEPVGEAPFAEEPDDEPSEEEPVADAAPVEAEIIPQPALRTEAEPELEPRIKQQRLFGGGLDDGLVQDAIDVVTSSRRASAAFLQRKLRIDYALAVDVLAELAARGVVALEGDSTQARVLG